MSRRERNKADKAARIFAAARELFMRHGYEAVTTQQIADHADVAVGTVFRYASTKADLLARVMNAELARPQHETSTADAPVEAVMDLLEPLIEVARTQPDNLLHYQQIVLFDRAGAPRDAALSAIDELEREIETLLGRITVTESPRPGVDLTEAARTLFSGLHMAVIRIALGRLDPDDFGDVVRQHVDIVLHGLLTD